MCGLYIKQTRAITDCDEYTPIPLYHRK